MDAVNLPASGLQRHGPLMSVGLHIAVGEGLSGACMHLRAVRRHIIII